MSFQLIRRRYLSVLLLLALLLQTLLPALGGATAEASDRWIEVCASSGVKWVKLNQGSPAQQHSAADHCVLCAATGAAPEFDARAHLDVQLRYEVVISSPKVSHSWSAGHFILPRAPPA
jgi:hypothetical protein